MRIHPHDIRKEKRFILDQWIDYKWKDTLEVMFLNQQFLENIARTRCFISISFNG